MNNGSSSNQTSGVSFDPLTLAALIKRNTPVTKGAEVSVNPKDIDVLMRRVVKSCWESPEFSAMVRQSSLQVAENHSQRRYKTLEELQSYLPQHPDFYPGWPWVEMIAPRRMSVTLCEIYISYNIDGTFSMEPFGAEGHSSTRTIRLKKNLHISSTRPRGANPVLINTTSRPPLIFYPLTQIRNIDPIGRVVTVCLGMNINAETSGIKYIRADG